MVPLDQCPRCGNLLNVSIVSRFNTEVICLACEGKERAHPRYQEAIAAERTALESGDRNFRGIGLSVRSEIMLCIHAVREAPFFQNPAKKTR